MSYRVPILLCAIAGSCLPSGFASSVDVCDHHDEFEVFRCGIENKCHHSLYPRPVDGDLLDNSNHVNAYTSILFYTSRCPFSRAVRPKFDVLSSMFPHIRHLVVEQSQALPSVFSRYGIHSLPSILMVNQTFRIRYHGQKDLTSFIQFYELTTGLKPVQYVDEGEPTSYDTHGNLITWLHSGSSIKEITERDPYLVLALMFLSLKLAILIFPIMGARLQTLWASYAPHLSLGILGETSQLFGRAMHMIDVRRLWIKLRLAKTRNFQERAKNALASVSLGKSTSQSG
ncbi:5'-adenylylsulfate reductase-like 7 [Brassica napus]|uniref:Thioredoxin domain-containing protein n=1 Tax=Brassica oleracea var. oleracea TaxID=109376 RepID=A0A0D3EEJ1_BRAOL|nr:PREDICTED: 5'-adenylylsulfate reductase-like 7 [Brassica oleracea var. oleracea]XP_048625016.1 5'-adenylylsulfate reductase-like 7 [Brassica napus]